MNLDGLLVTDEKKLDFLFNLEGEITFRYGKIGNGKTYGATADAVDDLKHGNVVYTTWKLDFNGYDQREAPFFLFASLLFPWKRTFKKVPKENARFLDVTDSDFIDKLAEINNAIVYIDEAHLGFDSYEMKNASIKKRANVLHTRHYNRTLNIISQRPTAVSAYLRGNVSRFYKYQKYGKYPLILFKRTEYQEMLNEVPDETKPESVKGYLFSKKIAKMYNSKYLAEDLRRDNKTELYSVNYMYTFFRLCRLSFYALFRKRPPT